MTDLSSIGPSPEAHARSLLAHLKVRRVGEIEPFAARLGLRIKEVDSEGFEGALLRVPQQLKGIVALKRDIREEGRKRFTICHEIGHFVLPGHGTADCICLSDEVESWRKSVPEQELAANQFAAELLLPFAEVRPLIAKESLSINLVKNVSQEFRTSLTATTLKCVEVTDEKCAVVFSVANKIRWFRRNENFRYFIPVNRELNEESYAGKLFAGNLIDDPSGPVPVDIWLDSENLPYEAKIWEDSIFLPFYDATITILTIYQDLK